MKKWLEEQGVPSGQIIEEDKSTTTLENAIYSMQILTKMQANSMTLVTSENHLRRSIAMF